MLPSVIVDNSSAVGFDKRVGVMLVFDSFRDLNDPQLASSLTSPMSLNPGRDGSFWVWSGSSI